MKFIIHFKGVTLVEDSITKYKKNTNFRNKNLIWNKIKFQ